MEQKQLADGGRVPPEQPDRSAGGSGAGTLNESRRSTDGPDKQPGQNHNPAGSTPADSQPTSAAGAGNRPHQELPAWLRGRCWICGHLGDERVHGVLGKPFPYQERHAFQPIQAALSRAGIEAPHPNAVEKAVAEITASNERMRWGNEAYTRSQHLRERTQILLRAKNNWRDRAVKAEAELARAGAGIEAVRQQANALVDRWNTRSLDLETTSGGEHEEWVVLSQCADEVADIFGGYAALLAEDQESPTP